MLTRSELMSDVMAHLLFVIVVFANPVVFTPRSLEVA
jgi:hypothetical protein